MNGDTSYLMSLKENYNDPDKQKTIYIRLLTIIKIMEI